MLAHEKERLVGIPVFQPAKCLICYYIRGVSDMIRIFSIGKKHGVVVLPLSFQNLEMIESCGSGFKMPFSNDCGLVSFLFQEFGDGLLAAIKNIFVGQLAIQM